MTIDIGPCAVGGLTTPTPANGLSIWEYGDFLMHTASFKLRGRFGNEKVVLTGAYSGTVTLSRHWTTFYSSGSHLTVDFIKQPDDTQSRVFFTSEATHSITSGRWDNWMCGTETEKPKCKRVRDGYFWFKGEYYIQFDALDFTCDPLQHDGGTTCRGDEEVVLGDNIYREDCENECAASASLYGPGCCELSDLNIIYDTGICKFYRLGEYRVIGGPQISSSHCYIQTSGCIDTDNGAVDEYGDGCDWYGPVTAGSCGNYDTVDFDANSMCCGCGEAEDRAHK
eukprot:TRINITY_DN60_c0_g1_i1.p1 TRINITY_DN60_c0_g1~~TRINITY_DN60_c0_g1_i1.p1  ORF type:complete len:282 (+),score=42.79 TRINITY_DN60_c0_g1_i1:215-1060(+)